MHHNRRLAVSYRHAALAAVGITLGGPFGRLAGAVGSTIVGAAGGSAGGSSGSAGGSTGSGVVGPAAPRGLVDDETGADSLAVTFSSTASPSASRSTHVSMLATARII
jgi:hypothetical protein